jgi:hypothetical protein
MSTAPTPSDDEDDDDLAETPARQRWALANRLAEIGMAMAEGMLEAATQADGRVRPTPEAAVAFTQLSRAVRLSLVLAGRMQREAEGGEAVGGGGVGGGGLPYGPGFAPDEGMVERVKARLRLLTRREEVRGLAEKAIAAEEREGLRDAPEYERLREALGERMDRSDRDELRWAEWPLGELAARICAEVGVRYDDRLWSVAPVGQVVGAVGAPARGQGP